MASVSAGACPSYNADLSVNISGAALNYQWQRSPDSTTWADVAGATSSTYTAAVTTPVFYRVNITSGGTYNDTAKGHQTGVQFT
jgi:hypothetical protein